MTAEASASNFDHLYPAIETFWLDYAILADISVMCVQQEFSDGDVLISESDESHCDLYLLM